MKWMVLAVLAGCASSDPDYACTIDEACVRDGEAGRCETDGFCSFEDDACEGGRRFADHSGALSNQCLRFQSACRISGFAERVWELDLPTNAEFSRPQDVPYRNDVRGQLAGTAFRRVAYCLVLDDQHAYVELDDFTGGKVEETALPTEHTYQQPITNLTVRSNVAGVAAVDGEAGRLELWPHCYDEGNDGAYDTDDDIGSDDTCHYGSFQIHHRTTTVIAYNHWAGSDPDLDDVGIGNNPRDSPDWTFAQNAKSFSTRLLQAFIVR